MNPWIYVALIGAVAVFFLDFLLRRKKWKKVLFVPTGALLSTVSFNEGNSVPGIAHGVAIEVMDETD